MKEGCRQRLISRLLSFAALLSEDGLRSSIPSLFLWAAIWAGTPLGVAASPLSAQLPPPDVTPENIRLALEARVRRVEEGSATADDRLWLVRGHLVARDLDAAEDAAEHFVEAFPDSVQAWIAVGEVDFRLARFESAEAAFERAQRLDSESARAKWWLGRLAEGERRMRSARRLFTQAHVQAPDDPEIALSASRVVAETAATIALLEQYADGATHHERTVRRSARLRAELLRQLDGRGRCELTAPREAVEVPLKIGSPRPGETQHYVSIRLGESKPVRTLLDTGAPGFLLLGRRLARRLGVEEVSLGELFAVGEDDVVPVEFGWVPEVGLGPLIYRDCVVQVVDTLPEGVEAVLGMPALGAVVVELDYPRKRLVVRTTAETQQSIWQVERGAESDEGWTSARSWGGLLRVELEIGSGRSGQSSEPAADRLTRPERLFVIDTGAARTLLAKDVAAANGRLRELRTRIGGLAGEVEAFEVRGVSLRLGALDLSQRSFVAAELEELDWLVGFRQAGVLGYDVLQNWVLQLDYRLGLVRLRPSDGR